MSIVPQIIRDIMKKLIPEVEKLRKLAEDDLRNAIQTYIYDAYDPVPVELGGYDRTYQLLNSVNSTPVTFDGNDLTFTVFLDPSKMNHTSVVDGGEVYVPPLVIYGHQQSGYEGTQDMFHDYPKSDMKSKRSQMLERVAKEIEEDLQIAMLDITTKVLSPKKYR